MREITGYNPAEQHKKIEQQETEAERNSRFATGSITDEEIKAYWEKPNKPLFEHQIVKADQEGHEKGTAIKVSALTEELAVPLLEELKSAWDEDAYQELKDTLGW